MTKIGITYEEIDNLHKEFWAFVESGMGKSSALDALVATHAGDINSMWLRGQFYSCGWLV